jgi:hypothetical protein
MYRHPSALGDDCRACVTCRAASHQALGAPRNFAELMRGKSK